MLRLAVVIETNGRLFFAAGVLRGFPQGAQAGAGGLYGGQNTQYTQYDYDPKPKAEFGLQPDGQNQKKQGGEDDGQAELANPCQQNQ